MLYFDDVEAAAHANYFTIENSDECRIVAQARPMKSGFLQDGRPYGTPSVKSE